jgi:prevent-host-death family protein
MNAVGIRALQQNAAAVVGRAHRGEVITITDRGRPVAELHPVAASPLDRLLDAGGATPPTLGWADVPAPAPAVAGPTLTQVLLDQRAEERH